MMAESASGRDYPVCKVDGCGVSLAEMKVLCIRTKVCEDHMKATSLVLEGTLSRFCQQCSRVEPLENFDGVRRSCRDGLARIGERRREKVSAQLQVGNRMIGSRNWSTPFASPALQQQAAELFPAPVTSSAVQTPLLMARDPYTHTSAPLPAKVGLKRASTGYSSGELEAARKLSRRISVTIRAAAAADSSSSSFADSPNEGDAVRHTSVTRPGEGSNKQAPNEGSECVFSAAADAAATEFRQQQQQQQQETETPTKGPVVLPNPFGGLAKPVSLSIRSHSMAPEPVALEASTYPHPADTPCSRNSTSSATPFTSDRVSSPAKSSNSALSRPQGTNPLLRASTERMPSLDDTHVESDCKAADTAVRSSVQDELCDEGLVATEVASKEFHNQRGSLQDLLQKAAAASREDAAKRRLRFFHSLPTMQ